MRKLLNIVFSALITILTGAVAASEEYPLICVGLIDNQYQVVHVLCPLKGGCECPEGYSPVPRPVEPINSSPS